MTQEATEVVRLGAGSFATVYVWQSRNNLAIKCLADVSRIPDLLEEFENHRKVSRACECAGNLFLVPKAMEFFPSLASLGERLRMDSSLLPNIPAAYTMQRVWPVPPALADSIRAKFFPSLHSDYSKPFIARIYLGAKPQRMVSRFFNANNFPLDANRCKELGLPVESLAQDMGRLLARIHHLAGLDGRDIEFVVGGDELRSFSEPGFSCFDFNQCKPHNDNVDALVHSFFDNDPYYPRPGMEFWDDFKDWYLREAVLAPDRAKSVRLGRMFLDMVEAKVADKTAQEAPEGRGNEMALLES
ncbi:uncharacterized protein LOC112342192 [Selaginella moellendorffii]|uniref:uncharacterized protein LOC112342192 n=1 Tax=Selaginella moellendorffii TaxID=88036 RepID=UPI000D1CE13B|nr:uncharacterized protein LOC112342192 [Selaginella moellendorffii]|eukprot:XP_024519391.1 uncharacterized protein LOC112342192 [Selaginella moellendorffii]